MEVTIVAHLQEHTQDQTYNGCISRNLFISALAPVILYAEFSHDNIPVAFSL